MHRAMAKNGSVRVVPNIASGRLGPRAMRLLAACCLCLVVSGPVLAQEVLTLEQARQELRERSPLFEISERTMAQTALLDRQARAILLPFINLTGQYVLNDSEIVFDFPNVYAPLGPYLDTVYESSPQLQEFFEDNPGFPDARELAGAEADPSIVRYRHEWRGIATVRQTLFNARAFPLLRLAELAQEQAAVGSEVMAWELDGALIELYFVAANLLRVVEISEQGLTLAHLVEEQARIAHEEGVGIRFEVTRAEVQRLRSERELAQAREGYRIALEALASLLHRPADFDVEVPGEPQGLADPSLGEGLEQRRPDLRLLETREAFEEVRVREARSRFAPDVFAQFQTILQRASAFGGDPVTWNLTLQASWDIFDGGLRAVERRDAELEVEKVVLERRERSTAARGELRRAQIALESERSALESAAAEAALARETLELTLEARALGVASGADVQLAQVQLQMSELAEATAELAVRRQMYLLLHAAARLDD